MSRKRDYLFKKPGNQFWRIRLQCNGRSLVRSLGTTDKAAAEIAALDLIKAHKQRLLERRPTLKASFVHRFAPGKHPRPDGGEIVATENELIYLSADGKFERTESNRIQTTELAPCPQFKPLELVNGAALRLFESLDRPALLQKDADDSLFEAYVKHAGLTDYPEREARTVWALFKSIVGKSLADCNRDDGRKLVAHYQEQGLKTASVHKKLSRLCSMCNFHIREGKLKFNPFSAIVAKKGKDSDRRLPLDDADMAACFANLDKLAESDALLFRIIAATGMRLGEAFNLDSERTEHGCRYVIVGTKTEQSERRVPLPASVLSHVPAKIAGRLFTGTSNDASKRLAKWLRGHCDISDPNKVAAHSLRHRAQDQLRAAGCPQDIRHELLGHEGKTVADGYGKGSPVKLLREWADKIDPLTTERIGRIAA